MFVALLFVYGALIAQPNARNGAGFAPHDTVRVFVVFADIIDDIVYFELPGWTPGYLPDYADNFIDHSINDNINTYISQYYHEASMGEFELIGDYFPRLLTFRLSDIEEVNNNP